MSKGQKSAIVAIHGVGTPKSGAILTELSRLFTNRSYKRQDVEIDGITFACLVPDDHQFPDLLEVNWSDIKRPPRSVMGVGERIISLSFALARAKLCGRKLTLVTQKVHSFVLETVLLWVLFPVLLGLMHANLSGYVRLIADAAVIGMAILLYVSTRRTTTTARMAGTIALVSLTALCVVLNVWSASLAVVNRLAVRLYGLAQMAAAVIIVLTGVEVFIRLVCKKLKIGDVLSGLAFSYMPLAMLSALGSFIWAIALNLLRLRHPPIIDQGWQDMFLKNLGYDLKSVEWAMAGATAALGIFAVVAVIAYRLTGSANRGRTARGAIFLGLTLMPLFLAVPGALLVLTSPYFGRVLHWTSSQNVWQVYTVSALRIVPWLFATVTPVAVLLGVLADVVFYITDSNLGLSSFESCNERLTQLLKYTSLNYSSIHVIGHSQGSVIAYTTLGQSQIQDPTVLTSVGSPLGTLYKKYLGWDIKARPDWKNLYRSGDYIGGPVGIVSVDQDIGPGGHTGYWDEPRILTRLGQLGRQG